MVNAVQPLNMSLRQLPPSVVAVIVIGAFVKAVQPWNILRQEPVPPLDIEAIVILGVDFREVQFKNME